MKSVQVKLSCMIIGNVRSVFQVMSVSVMLGCYVKLGPVRSC